MLSNVSTSPWAILTNEWDMTEEEVVQFYNQRGAKEKFFDQMDNDFGWHYLPKSLLRENTVFLLLTAMLRNFFRLLLRNEALHAFSFSAKQPKKSPEKSKNAWFPHRLRDWR